MDKGLKFARTDVLQRVNVMNGIFLIAYHRPTFPVDVNILALDNALDKDKDKTLDRNKILDREKTIISGLAVQKFALTSLHHWQMEEIVAVLEGRDSVVVQPTGSGKSMCFILPPLYDSKTAVVILPTISLMLQTY